MHQHRAALTATKLPRDRRVQLQGVSTQSTSLAATPEASQAPEAAAADLRGHMAHVRFQAESWRVGLD